MRPIFVLPCLLAACETRIQFDDILVDGEVDQVGSVDHSDTDADADSDTDADSDADTDTDTDAYHGPIEIVSSTVTCKPTHVEYEIETDGLMSAARFFQLETGNDPTYSDNHTFEVDVVNDYGQGDSASRRIVDGAPFGQLHTNESTLFDCELHITEPGIMTFAVAVEDLEGNIADCVAYGHDPERMVAGGFDTVGEAPDFDVSHCRITSF